MKTRVPPSRCCSRCRAKSKFAGILCRIPEWFQNRMNAAWPRLPRRYRGHAFYVFACCCRACACKHTAAFAARNFYKTSRFSDESFSQTSHKLFLEQRLILLRSFPHRTGFKIHKNKQKSVGPLPFREAGRRPLYLAAMHLPGLREADQRALLSQVYSMAIRFEVDT